MPGQGNGHFHPRLQGPGMGGAHQRRADDRSGYRRSGQLRQEVKSDLSRRLCGGSFQIPTKGAKSMVSGAAKPFMKPTEDFAKGLLGTKGESGDDAKIYCCLFAQ